MHSAMNVDLRPDSYVFGAMVDTVRQLCGVQLAHEAPPPKVRCALPMKTRVLISAGQPEHVVCRSVQTICPSQ